MNLSLAPAPPCAVPWSRSMLDQRRRIAPFRLTAGILLQSSLICCSPYA